VTVVLRAEVAEADLEAVRRVVTSTGFFDAEEIGIAVELVEAHLARGEASGYLFRFAEVDRGGGRVVAGYTCFGPIPGTRSSWDLYWIAVEEGQRGLGLGQTLLAATEAEVQARGGTRLYADTSGRAQYAPTRAFYLRTGFVEAAHLEDYYAPGDGKITFAKALPPR
jgi:GNAT superfamily N-acetyltransferase